MTIMTDNYPPSGISSPGEAAGPSATRRRTSSSASSPDMAGIQQSEGPGTKKNKARMTARQAAMLKEVWDRNLFPTAEERAHVAGQSGLSVRQVQVWFQNQRQKRRNEEYEATRPFVSDGPHPLSSVAEAASLSAVSSLPPIKPPIQQPIASSSKSPNELHHPSTSFLYPAKSLSAPVGGPAPVPTERPSLPRYRSAEESTILPPLSWGKRPYQPEQGEDQPNKRPSVSIGIRGRRLSISKSGTGLPTSPPGTQERSDMLPSLAELGLVSSSIRRRDEHHWQNMGTRLPPILDGSIAAGSAVYKKEEGVPTKRTRGSGDWEEQLDKT